MAAAAQSASALMRALGNEQRLLVLCHLSEGEASVGALLERLPLSQSALSQHLAKLREGGFVKTRREAQQVFYSLPKGPARSLVAMLHKLYCPR
ncbi:ArsR/SmtB family transcription factor [Arenimonas sp. MALMAid1274]|uniref:ArsR/SmtB family transcription factor n=1 Tax=Arenimonas sp. MALMAid1274 TaxID=3411630 RepID=UPI003BA3DA8E